MMTAHPEWMERIECKFDGDPRLIAGAATIVAHIARRAGLDDRAAMEISGAAMEACDALLRDSRERRASTAAIQLSAAEFPDHIEVSVQLLSRSPDSQNSMAEQLRQRLKNAVVDGVTVEIADGIPRVTLVRKCGSTNRRFVV